MHCGHDNFETSKSSQAKYYILKPGMVEGWECEKKKKNNDKMFHANH